MSFPWRMHLSWLVLAAGGLWGISVARAAGPSASVVVTALTYGYVLWSLYWGGPPVFNWWKRNVFSRTGPVNLMSFAWGIQMSVALAILFWGGTIFCVLGGGAYYFSRQLKSSRYHI